MPGAPRTAFIVHPAATALIMGRGRSAGYDDQRELILAKAAELFAHRGYHATSMSQVADACGCSKAGLYHYYRDKYALLVSIAEGHVGRLQALVDDVAAQKLPSGQRLRALIEGLVREYADAQHAHRVLTEEVRFLSDLDRGRVTDIERQVVAGVAQAVAEVRPALREVKLDKPMTMLLFGMVNWLFTWMRPDGSIDHERMAPIVADLFIGGLSAVDPAHARASGDDSAGSVAVSAADCGAVNTPHAATP